MLRTNAAARLLGVSPNTLRSWERRYGFPQPERSIGGHRQYQLDEIHALRQALDETGAVSSAIQLARRRGLGPSTRARLSAAYASFDEPLADRLLEESLAVRSVERTADELLLRAVAEQTGTAYEVAWRHAYGWLSAQRRLAAPNPDQPGILIIDPARICGAETLHALSLDVVLRRAGLPTMTLSPRADRRRLAAALRTLRPCAAAVGGGDQGDEVARLIYVIRSVSPQIRVVDSAGPLEETRDVLLACTARGAAAGFEPRIAA